MAMLVVLTHKIVMSAPGKLGTVMMKPHIMTQFKSMPETKTNMPSGTRDKVTHKMTQLFSIMRYSWYTRNSPWVGHLTGPKEKKNNNIPFNDGVLEQVKLSVRRKNKFWSITACILKCLICQCLSSKTIYICLKKTTWNYKISSDCFTEWETSIRSFSNKVGIRQQLESLPR